MSGYFSSLLTTTTSRYASLRSLIPSNSDTDGDTEDDTHICRVLRAYYIEKGRPFPGWLPPDPKAAQPPVVQPYTQNSYGQQIGAGYGGIANGGAGATSKLGSLWDSQPPAAATPAPTSLRQGARGISSSSLRGGAPIQNPRDPYSRSQPQMLEPPVQARPLPSQRAGSYQTSTATPPGSSSGGGGTAQDRLKARLWGARTTGPGPQQVGVPPITTSQAKLQPNRGGGAAYERNNSYGSQNSYSGGAPAAAGNYEDSFKPTGNVRAGLSPGGSEKPFMAATAPWATSEDEFTGGGYGGGSGGSGYGRGISRQQGQPGGSRGMR